MPTRLQWTDYCFWCWTGFSSCLLMAVIKAGRIQCSFFFKICPCWHLQGFEGQNWVLFLAISSFSLNVWIWIWVFLLIIEIMFLKYTLDFIIHGNSLAKFPEETRATSISFPLSYLLVVFYVMTTIGVTFNLLVWNSIFVFAFNIYLN